MRLSLSKAPLLPIALSLSCGIVLGRYLGSWDIWALGAATLATVVVIALRKPFLSVVFGALTIGVALFMANRPGDPATGPFLVSPPYRGVVERVVEKESSRHFIVNCGGRNLYVTTSAFLPVIVPGDSIQFSCQLEAPDVAATLPDQSTMENFMLTNKVWGTGFVKPDDLSLIGQSESIYWRIRRGNRNLAEHILKSDLSQGASSLMAATILGDTSAMDGDTRATFASVGIAHMLAISGMHAALIGLLIGVALWPLAVCGYRRWSVILTIAALWVYAMFTGLSPSVVRSVIMATLLAGAWLLQRNHSSVNALCAAWIVILLFTPTALFQVGFQLSFAAVAGIIAWSNVFNKLGLRRPAVRWAVGVVGVPLAAMMATGLLSAYYFHRFPVLFLLANVPIGLIFPWFMGAGVLWILLDLAGIHTGWLDWTVNALYTSIEWIAEWIAALPWSSVDGLYFSAWAMLLWGLGLVALSMWSLIGRHAWGWAGGALLCGSLLVACIQPRISEPEYFITNHRQNIEIIVNDGSKCLLLTDAIEREAALEQARSRYADYTGYRRMDPLELGDTIDGQLNLLGDRWSIVCGEPDESMPTGGNLLIGKGFKGDVVTLVDQLQPNEIYLTANLNRRRHDRYMRELLAAGYRPKTLRLNPLWIKKSASQAKQRSQ